jgi:hypothetical protein
MRNLILASLFLSVIHNLTAQTSKGDFLVGTNASAYYSRTMSGPSQTSTTNFFWVINPKVGFLVINNVCLGVSIPFSTEGTTYSDRPNSFDFNKIETRSSGIGPFLRYYFPIKKLQIIAEASYTWNSVNAEAISYAQLPFVIETNTKSKIFIAATGVGILINENIALELLLNYQDTVYEIKDSDGWGNEFDQRHFLLSGGFQFYLHKKT